jgi:NAD-dependent dihydropyrimidine dehydrogenase PreA subunit
MSYFINRRCTLCKACIDLCPTKSIFLGEGQYVIDADTCDDSGLCVSVCPDHAIYRVGESEDVALTSLKPGPKPASSAPAAKPAAPSAAKTPSKPAAGKK